MIFTEICCSNKKFKIPMCQFPLIPESSGRLSRAESGRLGKLGSVLLGSARFGIFVEYRAEPYNNHFQIIVPTSLTKL